MRILDPLRSSLVLLATLAACGGGGTGTSAGVGQGDSAFTLALTDAPSDEVDKFEVDVAGIELHRVRGGDVSVLAKSTRVDFVELASVAELMTDGGVPGGFYSGLSMTLDFTNALVLLQGKTTPATVLDANGAVLAGPVDVDVQFPARNQPRCRNGRNHLFQLDLDLDGALTPDPEANTVKFVPTLSVVVDPDADKPLQRAGVLSAVDAVAQTFAVRKSANDGSRLGDVTVQGGPQTVYQIDGVAYVGAAGFASLAALPLVTTRVLVQGGVAKEARVVTATWVEAGLGVRGNVQDVVEGLITARSGGAGADATLTVRGHARAAAGERQHNATMTVRVSHTRTHVLRRGASTTDTTDALQVGQQVSAFGVLNGSTLDATGATGVVRALLTSVEGTAADAPVDHVLTLDVARIGHRAPVDFDFVVEGVAQADPRAFTVDVTGLSTGKVSTGTRIKVLGWCKPVGAPLGTPDLTGQVLVNRSSGAQVLLLSWPRGVANALVSVGPANLTFDIAAAARARVEDGFSRTNLTLTPNPVLRPAGASGLYRIVRGKEVEMHDTFASFATALEDGIKGDVLLREIVAAVAGSGGAQVYDVSAVAAVLK